MPERTKVYCEECGEVIIPEIGQDDTTVTFQGERIAFHPFYAYCPIHGISFLIPETHNINLYFLQSERKRLQNMPKKT